MEKGISYLNRNFSDYRTSLRQFTKEYYPELMDDFDDSSIGAWLIDLVSAVSDDLSYHLDRVFQETNISSAQEKNSLMAIARSNGLKIPGPKASMTEVEFSCELPVNGSTNGASTFGVPDMSYAPVILKGTKLTSGDQVFEVMEDIDFASQFNADGISDRTIIPIGKSVGTEKYKVKKLATVTAGESLIKSKIISEDNCVPFYEYIISDSGVMNVESIIFKEGTDYTYEPTMDEFMIESESGKTRDESWTSDQECEGNKKLLRYFEVDSLAQQEIWMEDVAHLDDKHKAKRYSFGYYDETTGEKVTTYSVVKGAWRPVRQKFMTEFTDKGYLKIIFGGGIDGLVPTSGSDYAKEQISRMIYNDSLGVLPPMGYTMYVLYRKGGGLASNLAKGTLNTISSLKVRIKDGDLTSAVKSSITVTNIIPSVSGKDMPSEEEIRYLTKYNNGAQDRCVTVKDYYSRILQMPAKYGTPFRVGVSEENNKIAVYLLGLDYLGKLDASLPDLMVENIREYLTKYKTINDFVGIKSGKIINVGFDIDLFVSKNYNVADVVNAVITKVKNYMDVNEHLMGEDIFIGDLQSQVSNVDGVINVIDLRVYNKFGTGYSSTKASQEIVQEEPCLEGGDDNRELLDENELDLEASDGILYSTSDSMFEIKYPDKDIKIRVKLR